MWARPSTSPTQRPPWGEIGTVVVPAPDAMPSWSQINACGWDDSVNEGMAAVLPVYTSHRNTTVEVFMLCAHVSAAASGDVRIQLDVGPRLDKQAQGTPNDGDSPRITSTIEIAGSAGDKQNDPQYLSLGTFLTDPDDVVLLIDCQRLGADGADTFAATLYVYGLYLEVA